VDSGAGFYAVDRTANTNMALVEARGVSKLYSLVRAVDKVTLSVGTGETLGLVGESGCGKTTLGRCLVGLTTPSSGEIYFDGNQVAPDDPGQRRRLCRERQIVFQDPYASLDPRWRIEDIVEEPLRVHNIVPPSERHAEVVRLLTSVGLSADITNHYPHEFSGGQRQRIGIARALAVRPRFLVADEPVSALDVSIRAQILNLLSEAQRDRQLAMLFITHDLGAVRHISSRVAVMYLGAIIEESPTEGLFTSPRHPYTLALLNAVPQPRVTQASRPSPSTLADEMPALVPTLGLGCRFRARCAFAQKICAESQPPLTEVDDLPGHKSACHFAQQLPVTV